MKRTRIDLFGASPESLRLRLALAERLVSRRRLHRGPRFEEIGACWLYTRSTQGGSKGYGQIWGNGEKFYAHRLAVALVLRMRLQPEHVHCHRCDHPACFNPDHLVIAHVGLNNQDTYAKGRNGIAKLSPADVQAIRVQLEYGVEPEALAERFGVCIETIRKIRSRKIWAYLPEIGDLSPEAAAGAVPATDVMSSRVASPLEHFLKLDEDRAESA